MWNSLVPTEALLSSVRDTGPHVIGSFRMVDHKWAKVIHIPVEDDYAQLPCASHHWMIEDVEMWTVSRLKDTCVERRKDAQGEQELPCTCIVSAGIENPLLCCRAEKVLNNRPQKTVLGWTAPAMLWNCCCCRCSRPSADPQKGKIQVRKPLLKQLFETKIVDMNVSGLGVPG